MVLTENILIRKETMMQIQNINEESFKKYGKISFMSGLLNSLTYVGSSISVYAIAIFSEHSGWSATLLMWSGIAFVGMAICLALSKKNTSL